MIVISHDKKIVMLNLVGQLLCALCLSLLRSVCWFAKPKVRCLRSKSFPCLDIHASGVQDLSWDQRIPESGNTGSEIINGSLENR